MLPEETRPEQPQKPSEPSDNEVKNTFDANLNPQNSLVHVAKVQKEDRPLLVTVSYVATPRTLPAPGAPTKSRPVSSADASEYYAEALTKAIGDLRTSMTIVSVERVQAFLMLGMYEWSQSRPRLSGMTAWIYVGVAIRMAQALGLGEGDREQEKRFKSPRTAATKMSVTQSQMTVAREIRRRTMFSCLILDRLLGCGKGRVSTIRSEDLHIQLPCSDIYKLSHLSMLVEC
ncbi:fungal-specific transcription factor domain-containing protein [Echria macrotheca]|uniref:Fungal-specific transcription factor domain-containing protein n=1 Tax=Echria macrotheca TaxID=438768 RepID=A0AAJ0F882_9PEZI|nr:fungal-specific transcription factor domain-containing protein [Echria macrotheca]